MALYMVIQSNRNYIQKIMVTKGLPLGRVYLNENGSLFSIVDMAAKGLAMNYLDNEKLQYDIVNINPRQDVINIYGPHIPYQLFENGYKFRGYSKTYYPLMTFNNKIVTEAQSKWEAILNEEIEYAHVEK